MKQASCLMKRTGQKLTTQARRPIMHCTEGINAEGDLPHLDCSSYEVTNNKMNGWQVCGGSFNLLGGYPGLEPIISPEFGLKNNKV